MCLIRHHKDQNKNFSVFQGQKMQISLLDIYHVPLSHPPYPTSHIFFPLKLKKSFLSVEACLGLWLDCTTGNIILKDKSYIPFQKCTQNLYEYGYVSINLMALLINSKKIKKRSIVLYSLLYFSIVIIS